MEPLQIGTFVAFLTAFFIAFWIFYDSNRQGQAATWPKTFATALGVLTLPGVILAISPKLMGGDELTQLVLSYLGLAAGGLAVGNLIVYALRAGAPAGWQPCPGCRRLLDPTWDRCPYCGFTFFTLSGYRGEESEPISTDTERISEAGYLKLGHESQRDTVVLRPGPAHFAWLVVLNGPHAGHEFALTDDMFIGRDGSRCQIVLEDDAVSQLHARIRRQDREFILHDLGSTNGTFVNGEQVYRHPLKDHDRVRLGETELVFIEVREETEAVSGATPSSGSGSAPS